MAESTPGTSSAAAAAEKHRLRALFLLAITPAILLVGWIKHYAVNVPFGDEWALVPLFEKWHNHQLSFADLYHQHNEHRLLLPKVIYLAFAQFTHWNVRAEMFFSVVLCAATSAGLYILLRQTVTRSRRGLLLMWAGANLLLFSPAQAQTWMLGFGLHQFASNLCVITALAVLSSGIASWPKLVIASAAALAATFSFGNGLLLWPGAMLLLILRGERKLRIGAWLLVSATVIGIYFRDYFRVRAPQPLTGRWIDYLEYFLAFIGGTLARGREGQLLVGTIMLGGVAVAIYTAACVHFLRERGEALQRAAPWLVLGLFVLGSAALTAYSRVNWGPGQAAESRYVTVSLYFYLALVALAAIATRQRDDMQTAIPPSLRSATSIGAVAMVTLAIAAFPAGLQEMADSQRERLAGLAALEFCGIIDTTDLLRRHLSMVPGFAPVPSQQVSELQQLRLLRYRVRNSAVLEDAEPTAEAASDFGCIEEMKQMDQDTFEISGWAVLPKSHGPAPLVVLAYHTDRRWTAFAATDVSEYRTGVVANLHSRSYQACGWRQRFSRRTLPVEADRISAWAVDPLRSKLHRLDKEPALASR
jgi:hypothetical protein